MKKENVGKFNIYDLLIVILVLGVLFSNYIWLKIDEYPAEGHELVGLIPAVQVYRELIGMENKYKLYDQILGLYTGFLAYPPLSFLVVVLFYFLFGLQGQMVVMVNSIYIVLTLVFVYLIGKNIFNQRLGLLSAFILSSFPGFIAFSHVYWIEFGLMGYVCLDLYLLLKTNFFENRKYSVFLGISLALSMLHKYEFIPFVMGPLLLVIYKSEVLRDIFKAKCSNKATNLILVLTLALGLSSFWGARYGKYILRRMFFAAFTFHNVYIAGRVDKVSYLQSILSYEALTYYLKSINVLIGVFFFAFFFLSIIFMTIRAVIKNKKNFYILYLILSFIVPYTVFTVLKTKNMSHILSILPPIAILISAGLYFLKNRVLRITITSLIVVYSLNLHSHSFYCFENLRSPYSRILNAFTRFNFHRSFNDSVFCPPRKEQLEFAIKEIIEYINVDSHGKEYPRVLVVYERDAFKNCIFQYYSLIRDYQIGFSPGYNLIQDISECEYIIIEKFEGESIAEILSRSCSTPFSEKKNFKNIFRDGLNDFELIKIYKIPNGNTSAHIYKKKAIS